MKKIRVRKWDYLVEDQYNGQDDSKTHFVRCQYCGQCINMDKVPVPVANDRSETTFTEEVVGTRTIYDTDVKGCPNCGTKNFL